MSIIWLVLLVFLVIKVKGGTEIYINGYLNNMRRQTIVFDKSWGEDEYAYHMKSFVDLFKIQDSAYYGKLHRWLFE
jgi:hypothetical protein